MPGQRNYLVLLDTAAATEEPARKDSISFWTISARAVHRVS
jgi:hypothetical protein